LLAPNTPPVWFSGIPFAHGSNPLLVPILRAPAESFASDTDTDSSADVLVESAERGGEGLWAGNSLGIVTGFQTRDKSARVTWVGGVELFSDAYANKPLPSCVKTILHSCALYLSFLFSSAGGSLEMNSLPVTSQRGRSRNTLCSALTA
jgi:oligosaccharyltransferase complex subunit beta